MSVFVLFIFDVLLCGNFCLSFVVYGNLVSDSFASLVGFCLAGMNAWYEDYATFIRKLVLCWGKTLPKINRAM